MAVAVGLGLRNGVLDHVGSLLAPVGNAVVAVLVFVFTQLARPILWLVDKLGIDPEGARRVLDRVGRSASQARDRAVDRVGQPSLLGRLLGLALFVLVVWSLIRFMRRLTPESVATERAIAPPAAAISSGVLAEPPLAPTRTVRHEPPADRVRRWYGEIVTGLAQPRGGDGAGDDAGRVRARGGDGVSGERGGVRRPHARVRGRPVRLRASRRPDAARTGRLPPVDPRGDPAATAPIDGRPRRGPRRARPRAVEEREPQVAVDGDEHLVRADRRPGAPRRHCPSARSSRDRSRRGAGRGRVATHIGPSTPSIPSGARSRCRSSR